MCVCTLIQLKVGNSLPFVRRDKPFVVSPAARKVDDEFGFVIAEGL